VLTKKGKYALKAMVYLAELPPGVLVGALEIATNNHIPKKFLDAILSELKNSGFVEARKGKGGGFKLAREAESIIVGDVIRSIDGPLAPFPCASKTRYKPCIDCFDESICTVRLLMQKAQRALSQVFDQCTLQEMRDIAKEGRSVGRILSSKAANATF
jgi:Rrf2 family protein